MHTLGIIAGIAALIIVGVVTVLVIVDNTKVLHEEKALRVELADIQANAMRSAQNPLMNSWRTSTPALISTGNVLNCSSEAHSLLRGRQKGSRHDRTRPD